LSDAPPAVPQAEEAPVLSFQPNKVPFSFLLVFPKEKCDCPSRSRGIFLLVFPKEKCDCSSRSRGIFLLVF